MLSDTSWAKVRLSRSGRGSVISRLLGHQLELVVALGDESAGGDRDHVTWYPVIDDQLKQRNEIDPFGLFDQGGNLREIDGLAEIPAGPAAAPDQWVQKRGEPLAQPRLDQCRLIGVTWDNVGTHADRRVGWRGEDDPTNDPRGHPRLELGRHFGAQAGGRHWRR